MVSKRHLAIIDPAVATPELRCLNTLTLQSELPVTYHLPGLFGSVSMEADRKDIAGIIVLGSLSSVHDKHPWQLSLVDWLKERIEERIPVLGICFGHQLIAHMHGGKVEYLNHDKKKETGFREVTIEADPKWGTASLTGALCVSHNECVTSVPEKFKIFAKSSKVSIDGLVHDTLPIWTFQPHPEAIPGFLERRGHPEQSIEKYKFGQSLVKSFIDFATRK